MKYHWNPTIYSSLMLILNFLIFHERQKKSHFPPFLIYLLFSLAFFFKSVPPIRGNRAGRGPPCGGSLG